MRSKLIVMTALALALGGCNRSDVDHPKSDYTSSLMSRMTAADIDRATTPPASPDYGPVPPDANAADPATNASLAFPEGSARTSVVPPPDSDHSPEGQHLAVMAQDAATKAPDTASADEAKRKVYEDAARGVTALGTETNAQSGGDPLATLPNKPSDSETMSAAPSNPSGTEPRAAESDGSSAPKFENT